MPLTAGQKLGPYQVVAPLGAGGMGEVYKARDTRLDRTVAVKVLPDHIAKKTDARQRFEREARAVASLNHPNICTLFDIGDGYMVMEFIEGETLAERIKRGPVPIEQSIALGIQIADALDRAHRAGVTHRDVKPHNIMLTRDGVKLLDFGLAKSNAPKPGHSDETVTQLTGEGTVLGTPQYMAPEQFEGKEADARSDIWAFGAVLYEMATGQRAFQGGNYSSLVAAILGSEPAPMLVKPFTPAWLERLVRRCLRKDPERRWQSMRDVVLDLQSPPAAESASVRSSRWPWVVAAALALLLAVVTGLWLRGRTSDPPLPVAFAVDPPEQTTLTDVGNGGGSAISPDGRNLAFVATDAKGETLLYVRPLESLAARALPGTQDAGRPFWSSDSKSLAFFAGGKLKRIDLAGGTPVNLADSGPGRGGDWNDNGVILFGTDPSAGVQQVAASGGPSALVTRVNKEAGELYHFYPRFFPGGRDFLYLVRHNDPGKMGIALGSLDAKGSPAILVQTEFGARYDAALGRLLYVQQDGTLMARRLELDPPRLVGDAGLVAQRVRTTRANGFADFSLSRNGTLLYFQGTERARSRFAWRDRSGKLLETIGEPVHGISYFSLSPDGSRAAYAAGRSLEQADVWVMELSRGLSTRLTFNKGISPRWAPDGRSVYYNNATGIYRKPADGSGEEVRLATGGLTDFVRAVSPDGKVLLFGFSDIMKLTLAGGGVEPWLKTDFNEPRAVFSPDGRWVAYQSSESGRHEIYVQGYPEKRGRRLVSTAGGLSPVWRRDGKELYWVTFGGELTVRDRTHP